MGAEGAETGVSRRGDAGDRSVAKSAKKRRIGFFMIRPVLFSNIVNKLTNHKTNGFI